MFKVLFYEPLYNVLIVFYRFFGDNLGVAIILVALLSRLIIYPLTAKQLASTEKNAKFKEEYEKIKKKYSKNKDKQSEELAKMQAKYLPGQLSGCLTMIIQLIFFVQTRRTILDLFRDGVNSFNDVAYSFVPKFAEGASVNQWFLGIDLSKTAADIGFENYSDVWPYVLLALAVGASQFLTSRILMGLRNTDSDGNKKVKEENKKSKKNKSKAGKEEEPNFAEMMQNSSKQMMYFFPIMTILLSLGVLTGSSLPSGLSLYWTIQSLFVIIQQLIRERKKVVEWFKKRFSSDKEKLNSK